MRDTSCLQVFGPKSSQSKLYDSAIQPIVREVLEGFNCTVFAYGQTGTGEQLCIWTYNTSGIVVHAAKAACPHMETSAVSMAHDA